MENSKRLAVGLLLLTLALSAAASEQAPFTSASLATLGPGWAATKVNTGIFRHASVTSTENRQFASYYAPDATVVLAERTLPDGSWTTHSTSWKGNVRDAHNNISLGVSADGIVHASYDHHGHPLRYRRTSRPLDLASFGSTEPMTGKLERRVTYPQFVNLPGDGFLFLYRDGGSGRGDLCVNSYSTSASAWTPLHHPLLMGAGKFNPYWCLPAVGADGTLHLAWVWRRSGDASTNQNLSYARSRDGGKTWENSRGEPYRLPISPDSAEVIDPVSEGNNLSNQDSSEADSRGRLHVVYRKNDASRVTQYFHRWHDGSEWRQTQVTSFTQNFDIKGGGSLRNPLSRPNLFLDAVDNVYVLYRDTRQGGRPRAVKLRAPDYEPAGEWVLLDENLRQWEPTFDVERWKRDGILDLFVQSTDQGHHETVTRTGPTPVQILELHDLDASHTLQSGR